MAGEDLREKESQPNPELRKSGRLGTEIGDKLYLE